jgi:hypothetical protein
MLLLIGFWAGPALAQSASSLLPENWNPRQAGDAVLSRLKCVTAPQVKGAHDADFLIVGDNAYIACTANDMEPGENPAWHHCYVVLMVVDKHSGQTRQTIPIAHSAQRFRNETLPPGSCFVPRVIRHAPGTLRCFFASEDPGQRQSQMYFIDFDLSHNAFEPDIHRVQIETSSGRHDLQPRYLYEEARRQGFSHPERDYGLYLFDIRSLPDGVFVVVNNFPGAQNSLGRLSEDHSTVSLLGHIMEPASARMTESAINQLPDGSWLAILRQENGNRNYLFSTSPDGRTWSPARPREVIKAGTNSKPTLDRFGGVYYLGWQDSGQVKDAFRSMFEIDVSRDGLHWEPKYRFETDKSFQYPTFRESGGHVYLTVTQGDDSDSRKERIMFGQLEQIP